MFAGSGLRHDGGWRRLPGLLSLRTRDGDVLRTHDEPRRAGFCRQLHRAGRQVCAPAENAPASRDPLAAHPAAARVPSASRLRAFIYIIFSYAAVISHRPREKHKTKHQAPPNRIARLRESLLRVSERRVVSRRRTSRNAMRNVRNWKCNDKIQHQAIHDTDASSLGKEIAPAYATVSVRAWRCSSVSR